MSSDGNHTQVHMTLMAHNICACAGFFLMLAFQPVLCHIIVGEAHYMPCFMEELSLEQSQYLTVV